MSLYCTHCGTIGTPRRLTKGSFTTEVLLWLLFIIPGVIYSLWRLCTRYDGCPSCGQPGMIAVDSPKALQESKAAQEAVKKRKTSVETSAAYRFGQALGKWLKRGN